MKFQLCGPRHAALLARVSSQSGWGWGCRQQLCENEKKAPFLWVVLSRTGLWQAKCAASTLRGGATQWNTTQQPKRTSSRYNGRDALCPVNKARQAAGCVIAFTSIRLGDTLEDAVQAENRPVVVGHWEQ